MFSATTTTAYRVILRVVVKNVGRSSLNAKQSPALESGAVARSEVARALDRSPLKSSLLLVADPVAHAVAHQRPAQRSSRIDGQGAFAAEAIPARRRIGEIRGESISVREARQRARGQQRIMIVEVSDRRAIDASHSSDPLRFTNHSCRLNAVLRIRQGRVEFYAMLDVAPGEEITVNYGETHHEGRLRCRCGAAGCIGRL